VADREYLAGLGMVRRRRDFVGYAVEATDGTIGEVDESSYEAGCAYLIVDTGFGNFGKRRMIPAGVVEPVHVEAQTVFVALCKADIKADPDLEVRHRRSRDEYETYYRSHCPRSITSSINSSGSESGLP
jgi:hypothetical protein